MKILFTTIKKVFVREDVMEDTQAEEGNLAKIREAAAKNGN